MGSGLEVGPPLTSGPLSHRGREGEAGSRERLVGGEVGLVLECRPGEDVLYARMRDGVRPSPFHTEGVRVTL